MLLKQVFTRQNVVDSLNECVIKKQVQLDKDTFINTACDLIKRVF